MQSVILVLLLVACVAAQYNTNTGYNNNQYQTTARTNQQYPYNTNSNSQYGTTGYNQYQQTTPQYNSQYQTTSSGRQFDQQFFNSVSKASALLSVVGVAAYALL